MTDDDSADAPTAPRPDDARARRASTSPTPTTSTRPRRALAERHAGLEPGTETGEVVAVAGRLMLRRVQGKLAFGTLADSTGRIQLFAPSATTPDFERVLRAQPGRLDRRDAARS